MAVAVAVASYKEQQKQQQQQQQQRAQQKGLKADQGALAVFVLALVSMVGVGFLGCCCVWMLLLCCWVWCVLMWGPAQQQQACSRSSWLRFSWHPCRLHAFDLPRTVTVTVLLGGVCSCGAS